MLQRPFMDAVAWWAVSAPEARHVQWPWICQKGTHRYT
jgi:hypothetical protein